MSVALKGTTANYGFRLVNFDFPLWSSYEHRNWRDLDGILLAALGGFTTKGVWTNNTQYVIGDRVTDDADGVIYFCRVGHTTPATGTFAESRTANPTYWQSAVQVPKYRGGWVSGQSYAPNDIVLYDTGYYFCTTPHIAGVTFVGDAANWVLMFDFGAAVVRLDYVGQCRLDYVSTSQIKLVPYDGNKLTIGNQVYPIPAGGVFLTSPVMTNNQTYYIYAYMNGATMALEAAQVAPDTNSATGIRVKTGDTSRTLVGVVVASATGTFQYTNPDYCVCSWFNKKIRIGRTTIGANYTSGTGTGPEKVPSALEIRAASFLGDPVTVTLQAWARMSSGGSAQLYTTGQNFNNPSPFPVRSTTVTGVNVRTTSQANNVFNIIQTWFDLSGNSAILEGGTANALDKTFLTVETYG